MACEAFQKKNFWSKLEFGPEADASAIHGRLGAQVALLQSLILPAAHNSSSRRLKNKYPVDKPHTRSFAVASASLDLPKQPAQDIPRADFLELRLGFREEQLDVVIPPH
jgi:hypothetical protein